MASSDAGGGIRFSFVEEGVSAVAELYRLQASETVSAILQSLPFEGQAWHGIYSGSEIACFIDPGIWLPTENATSRVLPGEIGYYRQPGGESYGFPDDFAEICWFYDRDAVPSTPEGPVPVNLFGRFDEGWDAFASVCRHMRLEGAKSIRIEAI